MILTKALEWEEVIWKPWCKLWCREVKCQAKVIQKFYPVVYNLDLQKCRLTFGKHSKRHIFCIRESLRQVFFKNLMKIQKLKSYFSKPYLTKCILSLETSGLRHLIRLKWISFYWNHSWTKKVQYQLLLILHSFTIALWTVSTFKREVTWVDT